MSTTKPTTMIVCYKQQKRLINLNSNTDLNTIEKSISDSYQLQQPNIFDRIQIQFYHQDYQTFIDLCPQTLHLFQQIIKTLQGKNAPPKTEQIWRLEIIPKAILKINCMSQDSTSVDTYHYPGERIDDMTSNDTEGSSKFTVSSIENGEQQGTNRFGFASTSVRCQCSQITEPISHNPFNFHFENDIAHDQRKQYETDVDRNMNPKNSSIGGVLLRGLNLNGSAHYPIVSFQIPENKQGASYSLAVHVLTECDTDGNHYLHASKGIYDNVTLPEVKFGPIPNTKLVNPLVIDLSSNDVRRGKYEIRVRICNIRNLSVLRRDHLRKFPELNYFMYYRLLNLITNYTSANLNLSSEKYHIGCTLICNNIVQDRCISKLATEQQKRSINENPVRKKAKYSD